MEDCPSLSYREIAPSAQLAFHIECYWFLTGTAGISRDFHRILPDGRMEIVVNLGAPIRRVRHDGATEFQPRCMLVGQMDQHVTIQPAGRLDVVGVRFRPAGAFGFLRLPLHELRNQTVATAEVLSDLTDELEEKLSEAASVRQRVFALESSLLAGSPQSPQRDLLLEEAVRRVLMNAGRITVDALAQEMRVSTRELERRFRKKIGLGPKSFCRIVRFQDAFRQHGMAEDAWATVALECGFYDQPHFIKEFKRITGETPPEFFSRLDPVTGVFANR